VEETFNPNPKIVDINSTLGKVLKSMGRRTERAFRRTKIPNKKFTAMKKSSKNVGNGIINIKTMRTTAKVTAF
jgi:hypothetical protein